MSRAAIIAGGSIRVWRDLEVALQMCVDANVEPEFYVVNDMIPLVHDRIVACSLHPAKLAWWLGRRKNNLLPPPKEVWSQHAADIVTHMLGDWGGSSGLFAVQVAMVAHEHTRVVLCGVPMTDDRHFERRKQWREVRTFLPAWERRLPQLQPFVRSLSGGWTEEKLGRPTADWMR